MENHILLSTLQKNRIGAKYALITVALVAGVLLLSYFNLFDRIDNRVQAMMNGLAAHGALGMFCIALPANMTLVIQVPYNLPMFALVLYARTVWEAALIGLAAGIGGGTGEAISYGVARTLMTRVGSLEESALFRRTKRAIERRPGLIPYLVWLTSISPIPGLVIIVPVAIVHYPWQKVVIPIIVGKTLHNLVAALLFYYAADRMLGLTPTAITFDLTVIFVIVFAMIIAYQIEKSRAGVPIPHDNTGRVLCEHRSLSCERISS